MTTQLATTQTKMAALKNRVTALPEFTNWQPSGRRTKRNFYPVKRFSVVYNRIYPLAVRADFQRLRRNVG